MNPWDSSCRLRKQDWSPRGTGCGTCARCRLAAVEERIRIANLKARTARTDRETTIDEARRRLDAIERQLGIQSFRFISTSIPPMYFHFETSGALGSEGSVTVWHELFQNP